MNSQQMKNNSSTYTRLHHFLEGFGFAWTKTNTMMNSEAVWALDHQNRLQMTEDESLWAYVFVAILHWHVQHNEETKNCFDVKMKHELSALI